MKVEYSKDFTKALGKLSGKILKSVVNAINEVYSASSVSELTDCKKIESLKNVYRLRVGDKRAFFVYLQIELCPDKEENSVRFEYLFNRGEAYSKKSMDKLRKRDK